jgi:hypothetical protein
LPSLRGITNPIVLKRFLSFLQLHVLLCSVLHAQQGDSLQIHAGSRLQVYRSAAAIHDSRLAGYRLFLNGETHFQPGNEKVAWDLLMHLYEHENVRVWSAEISVSTAYLLNHYSETYNKSEYDKCLTENLAKLDINYFYKRLYLFNENKDPASRIYLRGVDSGSDGVIAAQALQLILEKNKIDNELNDYVSILKEDEHESLETAQRFLRLYTSNQAKYHALFKTEENLFLDIIKELICESCGNYLSTDSAKWATRENHLYANMLHVFEEYQNVNVFGKFGAAHTSLDPTDRYPGYLLCPSFASRLQTEDWSPLKGKVCTFDNDYSSNSYGKKTIFSDSSLEDVYKHRKKNTYFFMAYGSPDHPGISETRPQFSTQLHFSFHQSIKEFRRDSLKFLVKDCSLKYNSIEMGVSYFEEPVVFAGYKILFRPLSGIITQMAAGPEISVNIRNPLYGLAYDIRGGNYFNMGIKSILYDDLRSVSFYMRPQIGFNVNIFSLMYGYDFRIIGAPVQHINKQNLSFSILIPFGGRI